MVTILSDTPAGNVQIAFARFFLIGVSQVLTLYIYINLTTRSTMGQANVTVNAVGLSRETNLDRFHKILRRDTYSYKYSNGQIFSLGLVVQVMEGTLLLL